MGHDTPADRYVLYKHICKYSGEMCESRLSRRGQPTQTNKQTEAHGTSRRDKH